MTTFRSFAIQAAITVLLASSPARSAEQDKLATCFSCHGENGQSQKPDVPSLGGEPAQYALIQLFMYRERLRVAPVMNDIMKQASDMISEQYPMQSLSCRHLHRHLKWEIPSVWRVAAI